MSLLLQTYQRNKKSIYRLPYDIAVSILYAWCIFQAYLYVSKMVASDSGLWVFVAVYVVFTFFIRSYIGLILMNLLAIITLPQILVNPVVHQAGDKMLSFQPFLGGAIQIVVALVQLVFFMALIRPFSKTLSKRLYLIIGTGVLVAFAVILTTIVK